MHNYTPISEAVEEKECWRRALAIHKARERWGRKQALRRFRQSEPHLSCVDGLRVHETKNGFRMAVTGSRDRNLKLWDLKRVAESTDENAWCVASAIGCHSVSCDVFLCIPRF